MNTSVGSLPVGPVVWGHRQPGGPGRAKRTGPEEAWGEPLILPGIRGLCVHLWGPGRVLQAGSARPTPDHIPSGSLSPWGPT